MRVKYLMIVLIRFQSHERFLGRSVESAGRETLRLFSLRIKGIA